MTATDSWHEVTARADTLLAALQAQFDFAESLKVDVAETLHAAACAHLRTCLLQRKLAELITEHERWWHHELATMTEGLCPNTNQP